MDYCIKTQTPGIPNSVVPLTDEVCRLGSGKQCQILIATKSPHALTVFRQAGLLFVLNRTKQTVRLGGGSLAAGETAEWSMGKTVIVDGVSLKLAVNRTLPVKSADAITATGSLNPTQTLSRGEKGGATTATDKNKKKPNQTPQIVTIICCGLMMGFMYWCGQGADPRGEKEKQQLTELTEPFRSISSVSDVNSEQAIRSETLLRRIAQYRLAIVLGEKQNTVLARNDARNLCRSISQVREISQQEMNAAIKLAAWFEMHE